MELEQKAEEMNKVKQATYNLGQKETATHLKSQILVVCRDFCLWTWNEALDVVGVDPSLELINSEKVFYPPAIKVQVFAPSSSVTTILAQPTQIEDQPSKSSEKTPTIPTTAKEALAPDSVPTSAEVVTSVSRPSTKGQSIKEAGKEKETEDQGTKQMIG